MLKPYIVGGDVQKWFTPHEDLWIIYVPKNPINIEQYPILCEFLTSHRERLESRAAQQEWFELQQSQSRFSKDFQKPKIIYKDIADRPIFAIEQSGAFIDMTCFAIPTDDRFLCALLNSKCLWFVLSATTTIARGGFYRMKSQYIEPLPIPSASEEDKAKLSTLAEACQKAAEDRYRRQEALRRRIPDLCPAGNDKVKREADGTAKLNTKLKEWWTLEGFEPFRAEVKKVFRAAIPLAERSDWEDWLKKERAEIERLSAEIARHEDEINAIVYRLFDLTNEEIELLEANI